MRAMSLWLQQEALPSDTIVFPFIVHCAECDVPEKSWKVGGVCCLWKSWKRGGKAILAITPSTRTTIITVISIARPRRPRGLWLMVLCCEWISDDTACGSVLWVSPLGNPSLASVGVKGSLLLSSKLFSVGSGSTILSWLGTFGVRADLIIPSSSGFFSRTSQSFSL